MKFIANYCLDFLRGIIMTYWQITKLFFAKVVFPVVVAWILYSIFKNVFVKDGKVEYLYIWIAAGIPFGIFRMSGWLSFHGDSVGTAIAVFALNFVIGGIISGFVSSWKLICAVWYFFKCIYEIVHTARYGATYAEE